MADERNSREGPDLDSGIELDALREGEPFLGRSAGESVLLVRRDDEVFAIGATCTHYGGPLAEGLVVGDTVHCPWHHACFSLRTGEALGAPALNPVPCYSVEVREGRVYVSKREASEPLSSFSRKSTGPESVLIIGAGAAGSAAAEMLRREGYQGPITMTDPDLDAPYDRPNLSKDFLSGDAPEEWIPLRPSGFYADHDIDRLTAAVDSIDLSRRTVTLSDGRTLAFGALLLATGAVPIRLKIPGADHPHVHVLRSWAHCRAILASAEAGRHVVVLGASFIGMETAAALRARGLEVTVVAPDEVPFGRTLGAELGTALREAHEKNGVNFRLGRKAASIEARSVRLDDGSELVSDLVIAGIGVRPATALAEAAGLEVDDGVIVDERLETSARGVFAAGDIARYPEHQSGKLIRVEHWVVAQRQGQAAARNILGQHAPFRDPPFFWTRQWDLALSYVGHATAPFEVRVEGSIDARDAAIFYSGEDRLQALATVGRDMESLKIEAAMASGSLAPASATQRGGV